VNTLSLQEVELEVSGGYSHTRAMKSSEKLNLTAVFEPAPEGGFTCSFEEFPDVFSEGETIEQAEANLLDALKLVLEYHRDEARKQSRSPGVVRHQFQLTPA
jgi:predicted RNase H-like HicB family nuclease